MTVAVRGVAEADLPALCRVAAAAFAAGFAGLLDAALVAARTPESFRARFGARRGDIRMAVDECTVIGFSLLTGSHLDMLFVDPAAQGRGAGRALLRDAVDRGCQTLESFAGNHRARGFYETAGFRLAEMYSRPYEGRPMDFVLYRLAPDAAGSDRP